MRLLPRTAVRGQKLFLLRVARGALVASGSIGVLSTGKGRGHFVLLVLLFVGRDTNGIVHGLKFSRFEC